MSELPRLHHPKTAPLGEIIEELYYAVADGDLLAFPTDTVYGLACDATSAIAIDRVYAIKGRDRSKPLVVMVDDVPMLRAFARNLPESASEIMQRFWPGGLTLIVNKPVGVFKEASPGEKIGVRIPDDDLIRGLVRRAGRPLAVTSANESGEPPATTDGEVVSALGTMVDQIVVGATDPNMSVSTVLDITVIPHKILRPGAVTEEQLSEWL